MKKDIFKNLRLIAFGIVIALGASYVSAAWINPDSNPPFDNISPVNNIPINTGTFDQIKTGNLSVDTFNVAGPVQFNQHVFVGGAIQGDLTSTSTVAFGASDTVDVEISGGVRAQQYAQSGTLVNALNKKVCADEAGTLVLCDTVVVPPGNPGGSCAFFVTAEPYQFRHPKIKVWQGYATPTGSSPANPVYTGTLYTGIFHHLTIPDYDMQGCLMSQQQSGPEGVPTGNPNPVACSPSPSIPGSPYSWLWSEGTSSQVYSNPGTFGVGTDSLEGLRFTGPVILTMSVTPGGTPTNVTIPVSCTAGYYQTSLTP